MLVRLKYTCTAFNASISSLLRCIVHLLLDFFRSRSFSGHRECDYFFRILFRLVISSKNCEFTMLFESSGRSVSIEHIVAKIYSGGYGRAENLPASVVPDLRTSLGNPLT